MRVKNVTYELGRAYAIVRGSPIFAAAHMRTWKRGDNYVQGVHICRGRHYKICL